jgi:hypothetical protein
VTVSGAPAVFVTIREDFEGSIELPEKIDGIPLKIEVGGPVVEI